MSSGAFRLSRLPVTLVLLAGYLVLAGCAGAPLSGSPGAEAAALQSPDGAQPAPAASPVKVTARANRPLRFEQISIADGLSESVVSGIVQDHQGFLWFATGDGLNRYDGYQFQVFRNDPDNPNSLSHSQTSRIIEDRQGRLWIGSFSAGLNRFDPATGQFKRYLPDGTRADALLGMYVGALLEDSTGAIWAGTNAGLNRYDPQIDGFVHYQNQPGSDSSLANDNVNALAGGAGGVVWVGTSKGLDRLDPATGQFAHYKKTPGDPRGLSDDSVVSLWVDRAGGVWVGTNTGIDRLDPRTGFFSHYALHGALPDGSGYIQVTAVLEDSAGVVWAGLRSSGLCRLLPGSDSFTCLQHDPMDEESLSTNGVLSLYEDRAGILWVGTYGGGLSKLDPGFKPFEHIHNNPRDANSLAGDLVFALYRDADGTLWAGMSGAGLDRIDRQNGQITHYRYDPSDPASLSSDFVNAIFRDHTGVLWVGTGGGLDRLDPGAKGFVRYEAKKDDPGSLAGSNVVSLGEDRQGSLWVLTREGLYRYERSTGTFTAYRHRDDDPDSLSASPLTTLYIDSQGLIWVGSMAAGLNRLDPRTGKAVHFKSDPNDPRALSDAYIMSINEDSTGTVWVGTTAGLNRYDRSSGVFRRYRVRDGLPNDFIYAVLIDEQDRLWLSTNQGLARFDVKSDVIKNFDVGDGLQSNEFNQAASFRAADGEMFFGGIQGITAFYPGAVQDNPYVPPVVLTSLRQQGKAGSPGPGALNNLVLRWPDNSFDFDFAALNYTRSEKNQHAYMLEGFDQGWNEIGAQHSGRYTNLPGGSYTLRLKGSNNDGLWNEAGAEVAVRVIPPFWATWWFRGAAVLLLAGAVLGGVRLRVRGMVTRNLELERLVRARTSEIERLSEQSRELAVVEERNRLARDLHDSAKQKAFAALAQLGAANGIVRADPARAQGALAEAETLVYEVIEDLTFLIQEMYPVALKEKGFPAVLREYIFEWESRNKIEVDFRMSGERHLALQVEQALYRITQEALANVARHSKATRVEVHVQYMPDAVTIMINDDGRGFDMARRRAGVGLRSMQERIAMIGGTLMVESLPGKGTRMTACAPAQADGNHHDA